nr:peptidase M22 [Oscillospiraceae bacterium]
MKQNVILGIDTSNYTTSVAIITVDGSLVANLKRPLAVKPGERGLRQSDALFAHTVNLPELMGEVRRFLKDYHVCAVGVSVTPRNQVGSYMPCFLAGISAAESISAAMCIPIYKFSHQCGHIMAAIYSSGVNEFLEQEFAAFHISGGTTELVRVTPAEIGFSAELLGGSADLNAGQVIDRIGVYLGMQFPAGPAMEREALKNTKKIPKKRISQNGMQINLSGLENMAIKLFSDTGDKALVAAFVFDYIGRSVSAMIDAYQQIYGKTKFVCAGGVMCNGIIKGMLSEKYDVCFAEPSMSSDNAVGIAALALSAYQTENKND